jgi:hypothetical protein
MWLENWEAKVSSIATKDSLVRHFLPAQEFALFSYAHVCESKNGLARLGTWSIATEFGCDPESRRSSERRRNSRVKNVREALGVSMLGGCSISISSNVAAPISHFDSAH